MSKKRIAFNVIEEEVDEVAPENAQKSVMWEMLIMSQSTREQCLRKSWKKWKI